MAKYKYKDTVHRFEPDNSGGGGIVGVIIVAIVIAMLVASCAG